MFEWLLPLGISLANYIVITVFLKYVVGKWVATKLTEILKFFIIRSQRDAVRWIHYRERAMGYGHKYSSPETCEDGICGSYHAKARI